MPGIKADVTKYTPVLDSMRRFFDSGKTLDLAFRKQQLRQVYKMMDENREALTDAIYADIHRSKSEGELFEVLQTFNEVNSTIDELDSWAAPKPVEKQMIQALDKSAYIKKDPLGLVLIISPWNYPVNLMIMPLIGAIGAGNCVVIKPSEVAAHTSALMSRLITKYFDSNFIRVIEGGVPETTELLRERFDHIFYTGAPAIGKVVMAAAAKHLTPVTLELGGKCPAIIDRNLSDLKVAAKRIAWGKFMSCGQTCLAPDHVMCFEEDRAVIVDAIKDAVREFYGENPQKSSDYSRIISERHFDRIQPMLKDGGGRVVMGGGSNRDDLYIEPTILVDVKMSDKIMEDEIFGPVLPIVTINSVSDAVEMINERSGLGHKPLAVYIFSDAQATVDSVLAKTSSGGCTVNDVILHMGLDTLPFGGVGYSGMGRYHGKYSFDTFTHEKAVLHRNLTMEKTLWMRYPPYDANKLWWARKLFTKRVLPTFGFLKFLPFLLFGVLLGYFLSMQIFIIGFSSETSES